MFLISKVLLQKPVLSWGVVAQWLGVWVSFECGVKLGLKFHLKTISILIDLATQSYGYGEDKSLSFLS